MPIVRLNLTSRAGALFLAVVMALAGPPAQATGASTDEAIASSLDGQSNLFLKDGRVRGWGALYFGTPSLVGFAHIEPAWTEGLEGRIVAVAAGDAHSLFLKSDGTVWGCGRNYGGELGVGTSSLRTEYTPIQIKGVSGVKAIATGTDYSLFLKQDGTVWACGHNSNGQLGVKLRWDTDDDFLANRYPQPFQIPDLSDVIAIAAGSYHSLFLKSDGSVWGCGYNGYIQLGDGDYGDEAFEHVVPVPGLESGVVAMSTGHSHSLFLMSDGTVRACGSHGAHGKLGLGSATGEVGVFTVQTVPGLTGVRAVAAGRDHSLFLKNDGSVWACGSTREGQLGIGISGVGTHRRQPVPADITGVKAIAAGYVHSLFLKNDGSVWACGSALYIGVKPPPNAGPDTYVSRPVEVIPAGGKTPPMLSALSILPANSMLLPDYSFDPREATHEASVSSKVSTVRVIARALLPGAIIKVNGVRVTSGVASSPIAIKSGKNKIPVVIEAAGEAGSRSYTLVVERPKSSEGRLKGLVLQGVKLSPAFASGTFRYDAKVKSKTSYIVAKPTSMHGGAKILLNGKPVASGKLSKRIPLRMGWNSLEFRVKSEDGTEFLYIVTVTRR